MIKRIIYDITPFTLVDYPSITSCILWFAGCNMRCSYCYNPEIVFGKGKYSYSDALSFLQKRKGLLDGVVLSGGECTLDYGIIELCEEIKKLGFKVKIDTNGSRPQIIEELLAKQLVDYVALDFKAPEKLYKQVTEKSFFAFFNQTLGYLIKSNIPFEVRTTYHSGLLTQDDLTQMSHFLEKSGYKKPFFIQDFRGQNLTLKHIDSIHDSTSLSKYLALKAAHNFEIR